MKKVFSKPEDVAHLWANRHQDEARTSGGNFYFNGDIIYSYGSHFPIARIMEDGTVMFTLRTYSNTTAKHIGVANMACRHRDKIYCCHINTYRDVSGWDHKSNFDAWQRDIEGNLKSLARARKPEKYIGTIQGIQEDVKRYADYFGVEISLELQELYKDLTYNGYTKYAKERAERAAIYAKEQASKRKKAQAKKIRDWLGGETSHAYLKGGYDFLRVNAKGRVETTQAVEIPYEIAKAFHKLIKTNKVVVGDSLLNFRVDEIGSVIKIGCHRFRRTYLVKFGNNLKKPKKIID